LQQPIATHSPLQHSSFRFEQHCSNVPSPLSPHGVLALWSQQKLLEKMPGLMHADPAEQQFPFERHAAQHIPFWHC